MPLVPNDRPTVGGAGAWSCIDTHLLLREETLYGGDEYAAQCCPFAPLMAPHMWILSVSCVYPVKSTSGSCNLCSRVDASFVWRGSKEAWLLEGRGMAPEHVVKKRHDNPALPHSATYACGCTEGCVDCNASVSAAHCKPSMASHAQMQRSK